MRFGIKTFLFTSPFNNASTKLFKQFTRSAADHRRSFRIRCIAYVDFRVTRIDLPAGKGVKTG